MRLTPAWSIQPPELSDHALRARVEEWHRTAVAPVRIPPGDVAVDQAVVDAEAEGAVEVEEAVEVVAAVVDAVVEEERKAPRSYAALPNASAFMETNLLLHEMNTNWRIVRLRWMWWMNKLQPCLGFLGGSIIRTIIIPISRFINR